MSDPVYVTTGAWGAGTGSPLAPAQIDTNWYRLTTRIESLEADPPISPYPISIALAGTSFTMGLSNGDTLGPITFTIPMPMWRRDWQPLTTYRALDFFTAPDGTIGTVLIDHVSDSEFDWEAEDGSSGDPLYRHISDPLPASLDGLSDVVLTSPSTGQSLVFNGTNWVNQDAGAVAELNDLDDVIISTPLDRQILAYSTGLGWQNTTVYEFLPVAVGDETTNITTGTSKYTFRMPFEMLLNEVRCSLSTASASGNVAIDINKNGVSIFSTTLTIDATEKTSTSAATPAVITTTTLQDDSEITIDIDSAGSGAKGLKVLLIGVVN